MYAPPINLHLYIPQILLALYLRHNALPTYKNCMALSDGLRVEFKEVKDGIIHHTDNGWC